MMESHNAIFPTNSPINQLDQEAVTTPMPGGESSSTLLRQLHPLLQAKLETDKVYANGYFERNYREADKRLKRLLHNKVISAWQDSLNGNFEEQAEVGSGSGVTIQIIVGK
jgi:hypothetical protein